ncbi:Gfo/Idh/MocA family protein [Parapedobacter sp. 10938]|uniref:Gfo/Idh/MocA family protein n=1 Tax=Parapedobacter flavus TaxID=3110225 RepID=UPI002DBB6D6A|nr:Gfo/Idh/MocA family oxidoreductase [Parapedobacter sp. 10938]MEC3880439.1 Gfo/Idh/MocA family oxidoreductase [Parapedobacter sp. 10938]
MERRFFLKGGIYGLAGITLGTLPLKKALSHQSPSLNIGVIGFGSRGGGVANVIKSIPGVKVGAYSDIRKEQLDLAGKRFPQATAYKDYRALLDDKSVEAVVIAVPEYLHFPVAVDALQAGKHVYLEKTMTHTIDEANQLVALAGRHSAQAMQIGHQYRYYQLYHKVLEVIKKGYIGEVKQYECQYHRNSDWRRPVADPSMERQVNWRMYKEYSGGLMTELCAHQVDILNWFNGSHPLSVVAMGGIDHWKDGRETYDNIRALYAYPNGVKAHVSSILSNAYRGYSIRVLGTRGTIEIQRTKALAYPERLKAELATVDGVTGATAESWGQGKPMELVFQNQDDKDRDPTAYALMDFAACVREGRKPFSNVETGRNTAKAVMLANQAAESGRVHHWN